MKVRLAMCELATSHIGCCSGCLVRGLTVVTTRVMPAFFIASRTRSLSLPVPMYGNMVALLSFMYLFRISRAVGDKYTFTTRGRSSLVLLGM